MISLTDAKNLQYGEILHHDTHKNADGSCERWKVTGNPKSWKTRPEAVRVPVKHGLRDYSHVTEAELDLVHKERDCPDVG